MVSLLSKLFQSFDAYGTPITLTHQGKLKLKTACGGLLTIISCLLVVGFIYVMVKEPMELKKTLSKSSNQTDTTNSNEVIEQGVVGTPGVSGTTKIETVVSSTFADFSEDQPLMIHSLTSAGFGISFYTDFKEDEKYGTLSGQKRRRISGGPKQKLNLDLVQCNQTLFPVQEWDRATTYDVAQSMCLASNELILQGNEFMNDYNTLRYMYDTCSGGSCAGNSDSKNYHAAKRVDVYAVNSYYDESDQESPIKQYVKLVDSLGVSPYSFSNHYIRVRENEVIFLNGTKQTFYDAELDYDREYYLNGYWSNQMIRVDVQMANEKRTYKQVERFVLTQPDSRNLETIVTSNTTNSTTVKNDLSIETEEELNKNTLYETLTLLSQIGGFCYLINLVLSTFLSCFVDKLKSASIINSIKYNRLKQGVVDKIGRDKEVYKIEEEDKQEPTSNFKRMKKELEDKINESTDKLNNNEVGNIEADLENKNKTGSKLDKSSLRKSFAEQYNPHKCSTICCGTFCCLFCRRKGSRYSRLMTEQKILYKEMDIGRVMNQVKGLVDCNRKMMNSINELSDIIQKLQRNQKLDDEQIVDNPYDSVFQNLPYNPMMQNLPFKTVEKINNSDKSSNSIKQVTNEEEDSKFDDIAQQKDESNQEIKVEEKSREVRGATEDNSLSLKKSDLELNKDKEMAVDSINRIVDRELEEFKSDSNSFWKKEL